MKKLMNSINADLEFTTQSERDYDNGRLPTLSFEMWSTMDGDSHSYFERPMRSQVLTMKRSSQAQKSKVSILVNELNRHFEVMYDTVTLDEKLQVIDKFCQQQWLQLSPSARNSDVKFKGLYQKGKNLNERKYKSAKETLEKRMEKS